MQNICVFQDSFPYNKGIKDFLTRLEIQYEGQFNLFVAKNKNQLLQIIKDDAMVNIFFINELAHTDYLLDLLDTIQLNVRKQNVLVAVPMTHVNVLAKDLYKYGNITFFDEQTNFSSIQSIILSWTNHNISSQHYFIYKNKRKTILAFYDDILYFEGKNRNITLVTRYGTDVFSGKISDVFNTLKVWSHLFVRTHQSFIVNIYNVKMITAHTITMVNDQLIPISNYYYSKVYDIFNKLVNESGGL